MDGLFREWTLAGLGICLAACAPAGVSQEEARQFTVECPRQQRLFIADTRNGIVQALAWRVGPAPLVQLHLPEGASVEMLAADASCERLWVKGGGRLYAYDTTTLAPVGESAKAVMATAVGRKPGVLAVVR